MASSMNASNTSLEADVDPELDWILLRKQLDDERNKETFWPAYKNNIYVKLGLAATTLSFGYALVNMHNNRKLVAGASSRIVFQLATMMVFATGYYIQNREESDY